MKTKFLALLKSKGVVVAGTIVLVFAVLFLTGFVPLMRREADLRGEAARVQSAPPQVTATPARRSPEEDHIELPGTLEALEETAIYARVNGYLKRRNVDIGDRVESGAILAEIETPELDQEKMQAVAGVAQLRAKLVTAEASVRLARSTFARYKGAADQGGVSPQQLAESQAAVETSQAAVDAAKQDIVAGLANVQRLDELLSFAKVRAPFAGTITRRMIEAGGLVTIGNAAGQALFRLATVDPIRVMIHVPQIYAPAITPGREADLLVREYPGRPFKGKVTRSAGALDQGSRTLLTQIEVPNPDRALLSGMYSQVKLVLPHPGSGLRIPAGALIVQPEGTQVATVDQSGRIHFMKITIAADYGTELAINGVTGEEQIVLDPSDRLKEGIVVKVAATVASGEKGARP